MRRLFVLLAMIAGLVIAVTPVLAADTFHLRERGSGMGAWFSNIAWDDEGYPIPGSYMDVWVDAASYQSRGTDVWSSDSVCVGRTAFTITPEGEWIEDSWFTACGEAVDLTVTKKLSSGSLIASFMAEDCLAWDWDTGDCLEPVQLGYVEIDLDFAGNGRLDRYHGTSSWGTAGQGQYTSHGNGMQRSADVSGTVTLEGDSLIDDATMTGGWLFQSKSGYVEVWH